MRPEFIVLRCRLLFPWSARFPSALLALLLLAVLDCRVRPPASQAAWTFLPLERRIYRVTSPGDSLLRAPARARPAQSSFWQLSAAFQSFHSPIREFPHFT